jgi:hypothetical protein
MANIPDIPDESKKRPTIPDWLMNLITVIVALQAVFLIWMIWHYDLRVCC